MSTLNILYVDDEPDIREVAKLSLQLDPDISCDVVDSGTNAIEGLRQRQWSPDLILLDVMMPSMDGPATLATLRTLPAYAKTPVVFMTARAQGFEKERLLALGAIAVIPKPFDPMNLAKELRAIYGVCTIA